MDNQIKEKLEKQFELLSERSETATGVELAELTNAMINLSAVLVALRSAKLEFGKESRQYQRV